MPQQFTDVLLCALLLANQTQNRCSVSILTFRPSSERLLSGATTPIQYSSLRRMSNGWCVCVVVCCGGGGADVQFV